MTDVLVIMVYCIWYDGQCDHNTIFQCINLKAFLSEAASAARIQKNLVRFKEKNTISSSSNVHSVKPSQIIHSDVNFNTVSVSVRTRHQRYTHVVWSLASLLKDQEPLHRRYPVPVSLRIHYHLQEVFLIVINQVLVVWSFIMSKKYKICHLEVIKGTDFWYQSKYWRVHTYLISRNAIGNTYFFYFFFLSRQKLR